MQSTEVSGNLFARECLAEHLTAFLSELSSLKRRMRQEWIHSTRVHSRRTRAALEAFEDLFPAAAWGALHDQVRWITKELGKLREREVSLAILAGLTRGGDMAENLCCEYLSERLRRRQRKIRGELEERLHRVAVPRLRSQSERLLGRRLPSVDAPAREAGAAQRRTGRAVPSHARAAGQPTLFEFAEGPVERARTVVVGRSAPILEFMTANRFRRATDDQLHGLRIAAKKLRYSLEIFDDAWPGGFRLQIAHARAVQDAIGLYHDWCVLGDRIEREIRRTTRNEASHLAFQLGRLLAQVVSRKTDLRKEILPKLKEFEGGLRLLAGSTTGSRAPAGARTRR